MNTKEQLWLGFCAFLGVAARSARWTAQDGKILWRKAIFELLTAPAMGVMAAGIGTWQGVDQTVIGAIAALLGLLGPAALESFLDKWLGRRGGGYGDGGAVGGGY